MIARVLSALSSRRVSGTKRPNADHAAAAHAFLSRTIAPGAPIEPPPAVNDDPLAEIYEPVERELRRAGYLRG
jgi:hypothetical protein